MKIGELSGHTGVSTDALRFYERLGLIRSVRSSNGYRDYPIQMIELVKYISTAKKLGFSLSEIGHQLPQILDNEDSTQALGQLFSAKAAMIDLRIGELTMLKHELLGRAASSCPLQAPALARAGLKDEFRSAKPGAVDTTTTTPAK